MSRSIVKVHLEIPEEIPDHVRKIAEDQAHEATVLVLWQSGELSIREAAEELGLAYYDFLDLLTEKGIPVEGAEFHLKAVEEARQKRKLTRSCP
jgi:predicted HTH domain antitoxin